MALHERLERALVAGPQARDDLELLRVCPDVMGADLGQPSESIPTGPAAAVELSYGSVTPAGSRKRTRVPTGASSSQIWPPWASTIARAIASPSPAPVSRRDGSAR